MHYEEKIINNILCWRNSPDGEFIQKTPEQLTAMLLEARQTKEDEKSEIGFSPSLPAWLEAVK